MTWSLVQGASRGLGLALVQTMLAHGEHVVATCREPGSVHALAQLSRKAPDRLLVERLDVTDEESIERCAARTRVATDGLRLLINVAGLLHDAEMKPERRLEEINPANLIRSFEVNAVGPLLMAKHFINQLTAGDPSIFASVSARVGSIADNRLGGWYAYRASKAAQNMFTKNIAIEIERRRWPVVAVALHPGTVETDLSRPYTRNVKPEKLFSPEESAERLLAVLDSTDVRRKNGGFLAYDDAPVPW